MKNGPALTDMKGPALLLLSRVEPGGARVRLVLGVKLLLWSG